MFIFNFSEVILLIMRGDPQMHRIKTAGEVCKIMWGNYQTMPTLIYPEVFHVCTFFFWINWELPCMSHQTLTCNEFIYVILSSYVTVLNTVVVYRWWAFCIHEIWLSSLWEIISLGNGGEGMRLHSTAHALHAEDKLLLYSHPSPIIWDWPH